MKVGVKNTVIVKKSIDKIELLTKRFKNKRMSYLEYFEEVNKCLSDMTEERDFIEYMKNIGYFDKFVK
jgi:hypothetical protein